MGVFSGLVQGFQQRWGGWKATWDPTPTGLGLSGLGAVSIATLSDCDAAYDYATQYVRDPMVRTCTDFLARNVAQLPMHVYRRLPDNSRERLRDHGLALTLAAPNPSATPYQFIDATVHDLFIFGFGLWAKLHPAGGGLQLVRIPPALVRPVWLPPAEADGLEAVAGVEWRYPSGAPGVAALRDLAHFRLYDPDPASLGLSPLRTLNELLSLERSAQKYARTQYQQGRASGVIERPLDAPKWTPPQKQQFSEDAGIVPAGRMMVLEDGMTYKPIGPSAQEAQAQDFRRWYREVVAGLYQIPAQAVGILEGSMSYGSAKEMHKVVYQDTLGPILALLEQEIERAILSEFPDRENVYLEFLIDEKLRGAQEDRAAAIRTLVGVPIMSVNEARAKENLPTLPDPAYSLPVVPLNVDAGQAAQDQAIAQAQAAGIAAQA